MFSAVLVMGVLLAFANDIHAQERWGLEFRAGPALPTQEVEIENTTTEVGLKYVTLEIGAYWRF
jgi:hypothetical protein